MKKCEKHAGRQESDGTRVGINKELISLAVGGLRSWKGEGEKNGNALTVNKGREKARVKYSSPSPAGPSCLQREGAGGEGEASAKKTLPPVSELSGFSPTKGRNEARRDAKHAAKQ